VKTTASELVRRKAFGCGASLEIHLIQTAIICCFGQFPITRLTLVL
jgi:hypothetical protein